MRRRERREPLAGGTRTEPARPAGQSRLAGRTRLPAARAAVRPGIRARVRAAPGLWTELRRAAGLRSGVRLPGLRPGIPGIWLAGLRLTGIREPGFRPGWI